MFREGEVFMMRKRVGDLLLVKELNVPFFPFVRLFSVADDRSPRSVPSLLLSAYSWESIRWDGPTRPSQVGVLVFFIFVSTAFPSLWMRNPESPWR